MCVLLFLFSTHPWASIFGNITNDNTDFMYLSFRPSYLSPHRSSYSGTKMTSSAPTAMTSHIYSSRSLSNDDIHKLYFVISGNLYFRQIPYTIRFHRLGREMPKGNVFYEPFPFRAFHQLHTIVTCYLDPPYFSLVHMIFN